METLRVTIVFILNLALPYAVQRWDRQRLTEAQRESAWNAASWGAALYGFGPWSMIAWCWVTRHRWSQWRRESTLVALGKSAALLVAGLLIALLLNAVILAAYWLMGGSLGE